MSRLSAAFLALLYAAAAGAAPAPQRIVSLNLCTDRLLLALVAPRRIASLTWLARSEADPQERAVAARLPQNHGSAEEVLAAHPDLVLAGRYTTATTRSLLERVGVPVIEVDAARDWAGIRRVTRQVAAAVGEQRRGEALLAHMDAELAAIAALPAVAPVRAIGWDGAAEDVPGADTLFNTILTTAGGINIAARPSGRSGFDLEQVLRAKPRLLLRGTSANQEDSLRGELAEHPVLRAVPGMTVVDYPEGAWACAVPAAADYARDLARTLRALPAAPDAR